MNYIPKIIINQDVMKTMPIVGLYSRSFLISLTCSLLLHLIILLIILVPSNYNSSALSDELPDSENHEFSPSLLISYSSEKLEKAIVEVADFNTMIPRGNGVWKFHSFKQSFQQSVENKKLTLSSLSLQKSQLDKKTYTLKIVIKSTVDSIMADCLCLCYLAGVSTARSNYRSKNLMIIFTHESGELVNLKVPTSDCRLYAHQKITVAQFMQKIVLS